MSVFLAISLSSAVQRWERTYSNSCDDFGHDVRQTSDGGYIVAGTHNDPILGDRFWLVKLDSLGDTLWTRAYGHGTRGVAGGYSVVQTSDGGYAEAGVFSAGSNPDTLSMFLVKTDSLGDTLWTRLVLRASHDSVSFRSYAYDIEQTRDKGYVMAGNGRYSFDPQRQDFLVVRCDSLGETLWTRTYGGTEDDVAYGVAQTADGGFAIAGHTYSYPYRGQALLVRIDSLGDTLWMRTYKSPFSSEGFHQVRTLPDSGFAAAGWCSGVDGGCCLLARYNSLGETLRTWRFGGPGVVGAYGLWCTADGGYVLTGTTHTGGADGYDDLWLIRTNAAGDSEWSRTYGGPWYDHGKAVEQTADGGYIVTGTAYAGSGYGNDLYVIKTDRFGSASIVGEPAKREAQPVLVSPAIRTDAAGSITYFVPQPSRVQLDLFDVSGRRLHTLRSGHLAQGWHETRVPDRMAAGSYFLRLEVMGAQAVAKLVVPASVTD